MIRVVNEKRLLIRKNYEKEVFFMFDYFTMEPFGMLSGTVTTFT